MATSNQPQLQKLKQRISRNKSALKKEKQKFGAYDDGAGKRFMLFTLYLATEDIEGGLDYIKWYQKEFPDCAGEPYQLFSWAPLLARAGEEVAARKQLARLIDSNLYLVPLILGRDAPKHTIWHSSNWANPDYLHEMPEELSDCLTEKDLQWLTDRYDSKIFQELIAEQLRLRKLLDKEKSPEARRRILNFIDNLIQTV